MSVPKASSRAPDEPRFARTGRPLDGAEARPVARTQVLVHRNRAPVGATAPERRRSAEDLLREQQAFGAVTPPIRSGESGASPTSDLGR